MPHGQPEPPAPNLKPALSGVGSQLPPFFHNVMQDWKTSLSLRTNRVFNELFYRLLKANEASFSLKLLVYYNLQTLLDISGTLRPIRP
jgi:hypothetical protein